VADISNIWAPDCPVTNVFLETTSGSDVAHPDFVDASNVPAYSGSEYRFTPTNIGVEKTYSFGIKVTFEGGATIR
jgi:hypothetical protein